MHLRIRTPTAPSPLHTHSKSLIFFFETYTFEFRTLYGVFGACVEWRTSLNRVRSSICSSFSAINWHWWNPKGVVSCKYLSPFQEKWKITCIQLLPGFLDLCTLQVSRTIICSNIMAHLDEYNLLSDRQHAFRKRHSCENLVDYGNNWVG